MTANGTMQANDQQLHPVAERGWRNGLSNLLRHELRAWWGTRTWLLQLLVWSILVNGFTALVPWTGPQPGAQDTAHTVFSVFTGIFGALGVIVATQGAVVGEKQQGTAAWVLSKPASRVAFLVAKWIAYATAFFVTIILLQGAIAYAQLGAAGTAPAPLDFVAAMGLLALQLLAYLTLTLMLGTFFSSQAIVTSIAVVILFAQPVLAEVSAAGDYLPGSLPLQVPAVLAGAGLPSLNPLIATIVLIVISALLAVWRFEREEF